MSLEMSAVTQAHRANTHHLALYGESVAKQATDPEAERPIANSDEVIDGVNGEKRIECVMQPNLWIENSSLEGPMVSCFGKSRIAHVAGLDAASDLGALTRLSATHVESIYPIPNAVQWLYLSRT